MSASADFLELPIGFIRQAIVEIIHPSLPVRREAVRARGDFAPYPDCPITGPELRSFLEEFVSHEPFIGDALIKKSDSTIIQYPAELFDGFLMSRYDRACDSNWLGANGAHYIRIPRQQSGINVLSKEVLVSGDISEESITKRNIITPSLSLVFRLFRERIDLDHLNWRDLEKIVADLLIADGYDVELQKWN